MPRPKINPLPESEQSKQRSKAAATRLADAGGKKIPVKLPDAETVQLLERVQNELGTETASDTFLMLLRMYGQK